MNKRDALEGELQAVRRSVEALTEESIENDRQQIRTLSMDTRGRQLHDLIRDGDARVRSLVMAIREVDAAEEDRLRLVADAENRAQVDDENFWFRRFNTSLAIAHGAAFAAISSKLFDKDATADLMAATFNPLAAFAVGMVLAGAIPLPLFTRRSEWATLLSILSALTFVLGLGLVLAAVAKAGGLVPLWE